MELVTPGLGLIFWMALAFGSVLLILRKYAWRPILNTLHEREKTISQSLRDAQHIQRELAALEQVKSLKLKEAEKLRLELLAQARNEANDILREARLKAFNDTVQLMDDAKKAMEAQRIAAINEIRGQIALLSVDMAEKVLQKELQDKKVSHQLVSKQLEQVIMN